MKNKIIAFALIATTALSLVACGGSSDTKVIESSNTTSTTESSNSGYVFSYNGTTIPVDADAAPIVEALGDDYTYFESPSCASDGIGKNYKYNDFEIQTYPDGDTDLILYVLLRTDNVATAEGIDLSSSRDDIIAAYGNPTEEATGSMKYTTDTMTLVFVFDGDSLVSIEYDSLKN
ncbi:hypothetical protein [Pseudobutyrivibrio ruminis]|uniref:hypothetical protein n=1 Tax=Pseudobutyrivibrio ruminis TaxID=46206 RepID=UPI0006924CF2|nr:hypothetical protein [Pseudobutyrivibrio ruminis]